MLFLFCLLCYANGLYECWVIFYCLNNCIHDFHYVVDAFIIMITGIVKFVASKLQEIIQQKILILMCILLVMGLS
jgi:hypothetical protein